MPKKPTEPFGHIAFGKDGSVRKYIEILSDQKSEQQDEVAGRFRAGLATVTGRACSVVPCAEDDNDFWLVSEGRAKTLVEATEIVSREYLHRVSVEDYLEGRHDFRSFVHEAVDCIYGVDQTALDNILVKKITAKRAKHYARPQGPFWLLIWTVDWKICPFFWRDGQLGVSQGVLSARTYLRAEGADPFDEIWLLTLGFNPGRLWPPDDALEMRE